MDQQRPHAVKGTTCPFHKVDVSRVCHKCPLWVKVVGLNPQTNEHVDQWSCSLTWLPILLIESAKQGRHTAAAVENFRNEMINNNMSTLNQLINYRAQNALNGPKTSSGS